METNTINNHQSNANRMKKEEKNILDQKVEKKYTQVAYLFFHIFFSFRTPIGKTYFSIFQPVYCIYYATFTKYTLDNIVGCSQWYLFSERNFSYMFCNFDYKYQFSIFFN